MALGDAPLIDSGAASVIFGLDSAWFAQAGAEPMIVFEGFKDIVIEWRMAFRAG